VTNVARYLSLDWDHQQLLIVSANVGRGGVQIQKAVAFVETQDPHGGNAEALGKLLRERLDAAGIAPAPVLACVARERLIVKEVKFPHVPPSEEPALVRFQAVKELTDAAEDVIIDYTPINASELGERKALAIIVRKQLLKMYEAVCNAAGLKLVAMAPRGLGTLETVRVMAGSTGLNPVALPPDASVAALIMADRWVEFAIIRGDSLLLARSLTPGGALMGEVRRNVSVYAGQNQQRPLQALFLAGGSEHSLLREGLEDSLGIPVYMLDPFRGLQQPDLPADGRGAFAGSVGLLYAWAKNKELAINFVEPKQPKPPSDPNKRKVVFALAGIAAALVIVVSWCYFEVDKQDRQITRLSMDKTDLDGRLVILEEDSKRIKALDDWVKTDINWLDELYDLTDRFPEPVSIRLVSVKGDMVSAGKDKQVARLEVRGITNTEREAVEELQGNWRIEKNYKVDAIQDKPNTVLERAIFPREYTIVAKFDKRPPDQYTRQLPDPAEEEEDRGKKNQRRNRGGRGNRGAEMGGME
jgi:Tfp pilus assembly PilM family ATPase